MKKISIALLSSLLVSGANVWAEGTAETVAAPPAEAVAATEAAPVEAATAPAGPGDAAAGQAKSAVCAGCHGTDGNSMVPVFPNLAGQHQDYLFTQLQAFKSGTRKDPSMAPMVAGLNEQDMRNLSAYYSSQASKAGTPPPKYDALLGERVYKGGNKENQVAACMACHGPNGSGNPAAGYPAIKGQKSAYTKKQLESFKSGARSGTAAADIMKNVASRLSSEEMDAVSGYLAGLK